MGRFVPFVLFFFLTTFLFVGGIAAILYLLFSNYSGVRNIWLLLCGAPVILFVLVIFTVVNLYTRFGKPLQELFAAINDVEAGNLSARVTENNTDMFSELFKRFNKMVGELERAEQVRRNLTADIAHELRTPLHIIQGNLEGILDGIYEPTPEHINVTLDETHLLTRLVNDLQTLSLAETGQLPLHPTRFLLVDLLKDVRSSFASQAASQGIDLQTQPADPNQAITADYDRINQVLSNLVSNALRHTPTGGSISIATGTGTNPDRSVHITVKDTGQGIAPEDLPFIFDRFWRGNKSRTGRSHSGLGLAITKHLIHAHNGSIDVQSVLGMGSTFSIELPEDYRINVDMH
jgi:signal transduction histidine kinase